MNIAVRASLFLPLPFLLRSPTSTVPSDVDNLVGVAGTCVMAGVSLSSPSSGLDSKQG